MSIATGLSPNTQKDDVFLALRLLLRPWRWQKAKIPNYESRIKNLEAAFKEYHDIRHVYSFNSGRSALVGILDALGVGGGDEVLIQAFTCNAVPNPIMWMSAKPIYVDIADDLNIDPADIERKITPRTKAVIVQHTFGMPSPMDRIIEIARKHNLFIIEDCAHALGAKYKGKLVGTLGDVSFFSFGRDKVISSVYGGMAATDNPAIAKKIEDFHNRCVYPSHFWIFQQLLHPIIFSIALPLYNFLNLGKGIIKTSQKLRLLSFAVERGEKKGNKPAYFPKKLPNALAMLALHQFRKLDTYSKHRAKLAEFYTNNIDSSKYQTPRVSTTSGQDTKRTHLRFSLFHSDRDKILQEAKKQNIYLGDWYTSVVAPQDTDLEKMNYILGSCLRAEKASKQIFNLPTHINISEKKAKKIANFLNGYSTNSR